MNDYRKWWTIVLIPYCCLTIAWEKPTTKIIPCGFNERIHWTADELFKDELDLFNVEIFSQRGYMICMDLSVLIRSFTFALCLIENISVTMFTVKKSPTINSKWWSYCWGYPQCLIIKHTPSFARQNWTSRCENDESFGLGCPGYRLAKWFADRWRYCYYFHLKINP